MEETVRKIKQQFFVYRNGLLADELRKIGVPHKVIFGLNIPQITEISRQYAPDMELAEMLWNDKEVRESRLLACSLFHKEDVDSDMALRLASEVRSIEEADMLCFRLLKHLPFATLLPDRICAMNTQYSDYCAKTLRRHLE